MWALLGPTNTGKTHLAIERMLGHETGMIGLPLRLLAREVYERVKTSAGAQNVELINGEEKLIPDNPRYWVTTVESMPVGVPVDFIAIDEIQLAADPERGHVFTNRLMHLRGELETLFLGSDTIKGRIRDLVKNCRFEQRPRFSELSYAGPKKITRLPRRSAVVAFSSDQVYAIAELIRRHRGGAAVVMGALSPRTRNAQVALYQSGDVDFIVATDAIGMGLNMDVDHVAFASLEKFDGLRHRALSAAEIGQIAGRAGRYMNDGTFGVTADAMPLDAEQVEEIEDHRFEPVRMLMWRNAALDFSSVDNLFKSLETPPPARGLMRARHATDAAALAIMAGDERVKPVASGEEAVTRLWEVAQVPDFRKVMIDEHASLLANIYDHLMRADGASPGVIPEDWFSTQTKRTDRTDGDIDTLASRLAHIRTWTYVANRADWLNDPAYWQGVTRAIEDRLSDALHERLTQQFIDRRTSMLLKRLQLREDLMASVSADGEVMVEGEFVGRLAGLVFVPDPRAEGLDGKALRAASDKAVTGEIETRARRLVAAGDDAFELTEHGRIMWENAPVGRLVAGADKLNPKTDIITGEELQAADRLVVIQRMDTWLTAHIAKTLEPLIKLRDADDVTGLARGVAFRLVEALGAIRRDEAAEDITSLAQPDRAMLRKHGVRFGAFSIFMPALLKPAPAHLILLMHGVFEAKGGAVDLPAPPAPGLTSAAVEANVPDFFYPALGFRVCGPRAVRLDMLERLADAIRPKIAARAELGQGYGGAGFTADADLMSLVGCSGEVFDGLLASLGFKPHKISVRKMPEPERKADAKADDAAQEEKTTTEPAADPAAETKNDEPAAASENTPSPDGLAVETTASVDTPSDTLTATASETAPAETAATDTPSQTAASDQSADAPETPTSSASDEAKSDNAADATPAEDEEMEEIVLWRPARKGRPAANRNRGARSGTATADADKPRGQRNQKGAQKGRPQKGQKGKPGGKKQGKPAHASSRPPRADKPIDPDSPFAVLSQLKSKS
ncbi:MAG: helicase-related protein [Candidatus Phaeomarinobacter sp.]